MSKLDKNVLQKLFNSKKILIFDIDFNITFISDALRESISENFDVSNETDLPELIDKLFFNNKLFDDAFPIRQRLIGLRFFESYQISDFQKLYEKTFSIEFKEQNRQNYKIDKTIFQDMIENMTDYAFIIDKDGYIKYFNRTVLDIPSDYYIGKNIKLFIKPDYHEEYEKAIRDVFQNGENVKAEAENFLDDFLEYRLSKIDDDNAIIVYSSIKEQKKMENILIEQERELAEAQRISGIGSWHVNLDFSRYEWSDQLRRLHGISEEEELPIDEGWSRFILEEDLPKFMAAIDEVIKKKNCQKIDYKIKRADNGEIRYLKSEIDYIEDEAGPKLVGIVYDITERKKAEKALARTENKLSALIQQSPEAITIFDKNKRIVSINRANHKRLSNDENCLLADIIENYKDIFASSINIEDTIDEVFRTGQILEKTFQITIEELGDRTLYIEMKAFPIRDDDDVIVNVVLQMRDISELKKVENSLRESRKWLSTTLSSIGDGVIATDKDNNINFINKAAIDLTGWEKDEAIGTDIDRVFNIESEMYDEKPKNPLKTAIKENRTVALANHVLLISKSGRKIPIADSAAPISDDNGNVSGAVLVFRDVTERRIAMKALEESEQRLYKIVMNMPLIIDAIDEDGNIIFWNKMAEKITGYSADEIIGKADSMKKLYPDKEYRSKIMDNFKSLGNYFSNEESTITCKDGSKRIISWSNISREFPIEGWSSWAIGIDITEMKKAQENQAYLAAIIENTNDIAVVKGLDHRIIIANNSYLKLMKKEHIAEVIGRKEHEIIDIPASNETIREKIIQEKQCLEFPPGKIKSDLFTVERKNQDDIVFFVRLFPIFNDEGEPIAIARLASDVTKLEKAKWEIEHLNQVLKSIRNVNQLITKNHDTELPIQNICDSLVQTRGYNATWIALLNPDKTIDSFNYSAVDSEETPMDSIDTITSCMQKAIETHDIVIIKPDDQICRECNRFYIRKGDAAFVSKLEHGDDLFGIILVSIPIELADNLQEIDLLEEVADDIAFGLHTIQMEKKRRFAVKMREKSMLELKETTNLLATMFDSIPDYLGILDDDYRVIRYNKAVLDTIEARDNEEIAGKRCYEVLGREKPCEICSVKMVYKDKKQHRVRRYDEVMEAWLELRAYPVIDKNGQIIQVIEHFRDITDKIKAEEGRKLMEKKLRRSQKLETIGTLAGGIAHDFNNILTPMIGYAELCLLDVPKNTLLEENLNYIVNAGKRARDLVKQILTFSKQVEQEKKPLQIHLIVNEVLQLLESSLPSTIEIRKSIDKSAGYILADATQIHQVVMNLCTNAYQAMREKGGILQVELTRKNIDEKSAKNLGIQPGDYAYFNVKDTGYGMTKETIARIFEPFYTTKSAGEGTGLGLSVAHGIVESHDGCIKVDSIKGVGSRFHVYFPMVEPETPKQKSDSASMPKGNEKILIVDDEIIIVKLIEKLLIHLGYEIFALSSSEEAIELFKQEPEKFDLVITDQTMPEITGIELAREIHKIRKDLPILLVTGYSEFVTSENYDSFGISDFIMKPIQAGDIAERVRKALDS
ncbi:MAG: PAS domain S-box protein [Candidatus Zixiibacteriota bacterium]